MCAEIHFLPQSEYFFPWIMFSKRIRLEIHWNNPSLSWHQKQTILCEVARYNMALRCMEHSELEQDFHFTRQPLPRSHVVEHPQLLVPSGHRWRVKPRRRSMRRSPDLKAIEREEEGLRWWARNQKLQHFKDTTIWDCDGPCAYFLLKAMSNTIVPYGPLLLSLIVLFYLVLSVPTKRKM